MCLEYSLYAYVGIYMGNMTRELLQAQLFAFQSKLSCFALASCISVTDLHRTCPVLDCCSALLVTETLSLHQITRVLILHRLKVSEPREYKFQLFPVAHSSPPRSLFLSVIYALTPLLNSPLSA